MGLTLLLGTGCGGPARSGEPLRWGRPVLPQMESAARDCDGITFGQDCQTLMEGAGVIRELLLSYFNHGRDFREPPGPDGYLLQVTPLDQNYRAKAVAGAVTIYLYSNVSDSPGTSDRRPVRLWHITAEQIDDYWGSGKLLSGYLFPLDWGADGPPVGHYLFVVRMIYQHRGLTHSICQKIPFTDSTPREAPTSNPQPTSP